MTIVQCDSDIKTVIQDLPNKKYTVTIYPKRGVSITKNGLKSIEECMKYAQNVRESFSKQN